MPVEVLCPGCEQKVVCPDQKIGKAGKCPKCGTRFEVPDPSDDDDLESADGDTIEFLCPNGHKLSGPSSLQGKPGQCPHCNAKFLIPDYDEEEADQHQDEALGEVESAPISDQADDLELGELPDADGLPELDMSAAQPTPRSAPPAASGPPVVTVSPVPSNGIPSGLAVSIGTHPMCQTFETFWSKSAGSAYVEVYLKNGERIRPDHFATDASQHDQGVFAVKNDDGTFTLVAVAWDAVAQITVQGVSELPREIF
jgi:hypothetical protein